MQECNPAPFITRRPRLATAAMLTLSVALVAATALRWPHAGEDVALLFPPATPLAEQMTRLAALDARIVRMGAAGIAVARFERTPSLTDLWGLGIWAALDPRIAGACASTARAR